MKITDYTILERDVFLNNDILFLSKFLLGKYLISKIDNIPCVSKIVETEAYRAPDDKGSHAYGNKLTNRTATLFKEGGISYVYLCYGLHNMLNVVSAPEGNAHAILIRAVEAVSGLKIMQCRRNGISSYNMTNGPGKLCQALGINRNHDGLELFSKHSPLTIAYNEDIPQIQISQSPRVGIAYAAECAHWPWRFRIKENPWTSKPEHQEYPLIKSEPSK